jgi:pimeloyl-ACP methyl ester carboxylesterase
MTRCADLCRATVTVLLCISTAVHAQDSSDAPPYPPPGRLVDVGGWRLHLNCTGESAPSRPTVILEAGLGDFSVEWSLVQPSVARFARVCSYDRAGDGWSEIGPVRRAARRANEVGTSLGDLPLVVITRGVPDETGPNAAAMEEEHRKDHTMIAALSRRGKLVVAERSGHHVQLEEPELVVTTIREMVGVRR